MEKTIIIIDAGKGLGNHIGRKFGGNGFHVVLMARNKAALEEYQQEFTEEDIKCVIYPVDVAGCYQAVKEVVTEEFCSRKGTILVTGGRLSVNPEFTYLPLSLDKAALRSLCMIMKEELEPKGVHVGTVMVCGGIKPGTYFAPENIAEKFWELYQNRELQEAVFRENTKRLFKEGYT